MGAGVAQREDRALEEVHQPFLLVAVGLLGEMLKARMGALAEKTSRMSFAPSRSWRRDFSFTKLTSARDASRTAFL
jgi:hypothetical protein